MVYSKPLVSPQILYSLTLPSSPMIKDAYEELRKKHKLPPFHDLDKEFDISSIEEEHHPLLSIKKQIEERINYVSSFLENILHPNTDTVVDIYECRFFGESEKKKIFELLKKIQYLLRSLDESNILSDQKRDCEIINEIWNSWAELKEESLIYIRKLKDAWKQETSVREQPNYLG